ncbi:MAG: hypothetical protein ACK4N4_03150 [Burkholderiales bacterium]
MAIADAPVINGNLTDVLLKVTMAWPSWDTLAPSLPGWHLIGASELGVSGAQLVNGVYTNANAEAIVASATYDGHRTLAIGFRGTNDNEDWRQDFRNVNEHYDLFAPLVAAVDAAVGRGEFDLVLVTGHSLGGAMTQMFMANYAGIAPAYAITTGSPGYLQPGPVADDRIINYQVADDPIVVLADNRAEVGALLSSPLLGGVMLNTLASALSASFGFPPSLFIDSVPYFTQNYYDRGTNQLLHVPGHPDTPPSVLSLVSSYNANAHEFPAYVAGIGMMNGNPFDLMAGSRGGAGHDALFGTTGNDTIDGGAGYDTLYLHVNRADAALTLGPDGSPVMVANPASGTDTLTGVERLAFADKRLAFDLGADQSAGMTVRVIGAAFDAPAIQQHPEWVGMGLQLFDGGKSLLEVCQLVIGAMGNPSNETFVDTVYANVVGSPPSATDRAYFVGLLQGSGGTMSQAELLQLAATVDANAVNIGLVGLQQSGVEFA